MKRFLCILCALVSLSVAQAQTSLDKNMAAEAIRYLNAIRQDPPAYADSVGFPGLRRIQAMPALKKHDILMTVAEEKARDMASQNYFSHVNKKGEGINIMIHRAGYTLPESQLKDKKANAFESLSAGSETAQEHINTLIIDEGVSPAFHRMHLLGLESFWARCTDIGVGVAYDPASTYGYYMCIIIAWQ
ncbi:MAG: CAP domain-containing protein [Bacteroidia bacterium]|nr:CAP domain-containing protein [Bacteroidia bacterium]